MKQKYNNILKATRLLALVVLMAFGAGLKGWGQTTTLPDIAVGQSEEIRYIINNKDYSFRLQDEGIRDNLNGYIKWYQKTGESSNINNLTGVDLIQGTNYFYWAGSSNNTTAPAGEVVYKKEEIENNQDEVICEASSVYGGNVITLKRRYIIREASSREAVLSKNLDNTIWSSWITNVESSLTLEKLDDFKNLFFESYEIHTPMKSGTSYRLAEVLNNYIVKDNSGNLQYPNKVRWRVYNSEGILEKNGFYKQSYKDGKESQDVPVSNGSVVFSTGDKYNLPNIFSYYYPYNTDKENEQQVFYLTAEVSYEEQKWYPISFLKVYLEPNSEAMTKVDLDDLKEDSPLYIRTDKYLSEPAYRELARLDFDDIKSLGYPTADSNYPSFEELEKILVANSYYAYAAPRFYANRRNGNRFVGRGEYGLYKTLGYRGISPIPKQNGVEDPDPYYANWALESYQVMVTDRRHEEDPNKYGYFFYVDASDEAGVITKISLDKSALCPNTRIIVTAWVCNLQSTASDQSGALNADIGLTFKGKLNGQETILNKFYSGEIKNNPATASSFTEHAKWQQVYFAFDFSENIDYEEYILEVANNCRHSNGADYAIDDIRIYRSLPDIEVRRQNACDASTLQVVSDYETILRNMAWNKGQNVTTNFDFTNLELKKYRYGLMGEKGDETHSTTGNVYYAFLDRNDTYYINVDKELGEGLNELTHALRIIVSTDLDGDHFPTTQEEALKRERILNLRAVADYNRDIELWQKFDPETHSAAIDETNENEAILTLYKRLKMPRIRVPYYTRTAGGIVKLHLASLEVDNTDLKYEGEIQADGTPASGEYRVMMFRPKDYSGNDIQPEPDALCSLISNFTVWRATDVKIETEAAAQTALCEGAIRKITASLKAYDENTGKPVDMPSGSYIFDWYLSTEEAYWKLFDVNGFTVKQALKSYRDLNDEYTGVIKSEDVQSWIDNNSTNEEVEKYGKLLLDLLGQDLLRTGTVADEPFVLQIKDFNEIMAMPYIEQQEGFLYCTDETRVPLPVSSNDSPIINPGFPSVAYPVDTDIALRLGHKNMSENVSLIIPVQNNFEMATKAEYLGLGTKNTAMWLNDAEKNYPEVGKVTDLHIEKGMSNATVSFYLNVEAKNLLLEGGEYELLIPFVQYGDVDNNGVVEILSGECDGLISLPVKIVPEYLTWNGNGSTWYNDENAWTISTKNELYNKSDVTNEKENVYSFSPLYFTKITVLDDKELPLYNEAEQNSIEKKTPLDFTKMGIEKNTTSNIQYDMAVYSTDGGKNVSVEPYYGNIVSEIYFKPKATLMNQHYLDYQKAWVEFEMSKEKPYWMSSPLKDVYAGDMYAPAATGRQETPAFDEITYNKISGTNSRWGLPFYQKAWNKAVTYSTNEDGTTSKNVEIVKSNWSIEYNDVWVPYTVGKGFYSRVENKDALVRLPKDDKEYGYETKALSTKPGSRQNSGKLHTDGTTDGTITLNLSSVDGDDGHFLIGNPYMAYLKMDGVNGFLAQNSDVLNPKYWTLDNETVIVGTPDIKWENEQTSGYIAPMRAFFVERKGYSTTGTQVDEGAANTDLTVTFSIDMTVANPTSKEGETSTRAFKATNPQLTILAKGAEGKSVSFVVQSDFAENVYKSDEDAVALLDSELKIPMVYTVAGNCAAAVNKVKDMQNIPLGVYAEEDEEVEVTIEGMSQFVDSLYLHDALTGKSVLLDGDTYTLRVNGENHGRYTITTKGGITVESNICVYSPSSNNLMIAASPSETLEQVRVFDMSGRMVENRADLGSSNCRLRVASGIYIVYAKTEAGETKVKVRVK